MSGDWKHGTLAMIRDKATADRNEWRAVKDAKGWLGTDPGMGWVSDADVTDVRPLVVLDPENPSLRYFLSRWCDTPPRKRAAAETTVGAAWYIADQIEAQTKPPRIPEPGLWGVVEAGVKQHDARCHWINLGGHWRPDDTDEYDRMWGDLIDPVLVREGVA